MLETSSTIKDSLVDLTAGSVGGVAIVLAGQPLDTVKVKMQTFPNMYKGMLNCLIKTYKTEGLFRGLYAGTTPAIVANVAENSVLFACYGLCQKVVAKIVNAPNVEELNTLSNATAGFLASFFSSVTLCPTELIKIKLQCAREVASVTQSKAEISAFKVVQTILKADGLLGLFKGFQPTVIREMPGYFVFFGTYEGMRTLLAPHGKTKEECGVLSTIIAGGLSGIALWIVIFPIDVVKSRIQVSHLNNHSLWNVTFKMIKTEGALSLYNGLQPTLIRTIPATAALFLCYEWTKKVLYQVLP